MGSEVDTENPIDRLKNKYAQDWGVLAIYSSAQLDVSEIVIEVVSDDDLNRIKFETGGKWEGIQIHFLGPIYSTGQLNPEYEKRILDLYNDPEYFHYGFPEKQKLRSSLYTEARIDGSNLWKGMNEFDRRKFLSEYIKKKRKVIPKFANCGDKFLLPD